MFFNCQFLQDQGHAVTALVVACYLLNGCLDYISAKSQFFLSPSIVVYSSKMMSSLYLSKCTLASQYLCVGRLIYLLFLYQFTFLLLHVNVL